MEYRKIIEIEFKDFNREVLEKSWEWLNDPQIKDLTAAPDLDIESSKKWFENLKNKKDYMIKSMCYNNKPLGVVGLRNITDKDGEVFGYIGEKEYWGKTVGVQAMEYTINYGKSINLESIYSVILKKNQSSYKLHRRFGFVKEVDKDENNIIMRLYLNSN